MRRGPLTLIVAAAASLVACKAARVPEPRATVAPAPAEVAAPQTGLELYEIPIADERTSFPIALAQTDDEVLLFATDRDGLARYSLDLDAHTAARTEVLPLDRYTNVAAYDHAHDRLWWTAPLDHHRFFQPRGNDFPAGDRVLVNSSTIEHSEGLRATIRVCPPASNTLGEGVMCDHQIRTLLPADDGVLLGGDLAENVGHVSAEAWIGFADASGTLMAEHRVPGSGATSIGAIARSNQGVLAVAWSGHAEPARASFLLFGGPTLELLNTAPRAAPSWISSPWSAAVAAPDGGFWVVLTTHRHELTLVAIASDGSITAEHAIEGAELPISSVQAFGLRGGEPWLLISDLYDEPLWAGRIDPATGAVPEHYEIPLPTDFAPERMLVLDRGFLLAGRVNLERLLAVWIPLD